MPVTEPPPNFREGHPHLELEVFERVAASPHAFIQPRIRIWREYQHEMSKAFEHTWNWPVPELTGLEGAERQREVDDLCRAEIERTLREVTSRMQRQYDTRNAREALRAGAGAGEGVSP